MRKPLAKPRRMRLRSPSLSPSLSLSVSIALSPFLPLSLRFYLSLFSISPFHFLSLSFILSLSSAPHTRARAQEHVTIELVLTFSPLSQEEQRIGTSSPPWLSVPKVDFLFKLESKIACQISHAEFPNPFPPSQGRNKEQPDDEAQAGVNVEGMQRITNNIYCNLSIQGADTSSGSANQTVNRASSGTPASGACSRTIHMCVYTCVCVCVYIWI